MTVDVPTFAIVGAVNHGKSSVVSALAEDDGVRISAMPGETMANQRFGLKDLLVLIDTPGFQNARKTLAALDALGTATDPLDPFRRFVERHRHDPAFDAECHLLQPIVDGAGVIYVVDASSPLRDIHRCEMEILRRTGAPRLAIVNRTGIDDHVDAWKGQLDQHFNIVRAFDTHRVTHADRRELIEALMSIERRWQDRLRDALRVIDAERRDRVTDAAAVVAELLVDALRHRETEAVDTDDEAARRMLGGTLKDRFMATLSTRERDAHRGLIALYAHRHVRPDALPADLFDESLFAERTWQLFGLDLKQLVGVSAMAGGVAGVGVDAATLGHSLGLGAAIGAAAGGAGAWALGKRRPEVRLGLPKAVLPGFAGRVLGRHALRVGGGELVVGPFTAANFPWILIDRALCVFAVAHTRSHARRDVAVVDGRSVLPRLDALRLSVAHWPDAVRKRAESVFRACRDARGPTSEQVAELRELLVERLLLVAAEERAIGAALA